MSRGTYKKLPTSTFRYVINGKYVFKAALDDTYTVSVACLNFNSGQYKKIMEKTMEKLCESTYDETYREYYETYQKSLKYPVAWKTCPFPTGPNEIINYYLEDVGSLLPAYLPGGEKWKVEMRISKDGEVLGGWDAFILLRSEKSLLGV